MIYITTGANGAGKTLITLKRVREKQLAENRPVYFAGVPLKPEKITEFGWTEFDPKLWETAPDGTIFLFDECQDYFPAKSATAAREDYIKLLAKHRHRGFDFFLISPHPSMIDVYIRKLVNNPSWHRHMKRQAGAQLVSQLEWSFVKDTPEKPGSGADGSVTLVPYPKEVYEWYDSTSLNTAKVSIPRALYVLLGCAVLVPACGYFTYSFIRDRYFPAPATVAAKAAKAGTSSTPAIAPVPGTSTPTTNSKPAPLTPAEYVASFAPRVVGFQHTAPRYDSITAPTVAPYPAACMTNGKTCKCWTQQGTVLDVAKPLCTSIVQRGYFVDWLPQQDRRDNMQQQDQQQQLARDQSASRPPPTTMELPITTDPSAPRSGSLAEVVKSAAAARAM